MNGQLSNGLPSLITSGNRILKSTTRESIILRGINRSGLEFAGPDEQGFLSGAAISRYEIEVIVKEWQCNVIRLPFNQDFVWNGRYGHSGDEYQRALDQVIYWSSLYKAYTLLDLQWLDADRVYGVSQGKNNFVAPLPNSSSTKLWAMVARRYKDEPAVLYDLFTEPHDRLPDDPYPLNKEDGTTYPTDQWQVTANEWTPWARKLTNAIRNENPNAVVFISGTTWAYDLRGMVMDDLSNVVYSTHVYSNKKLVNGDPKLVTNAGYDWPEAFGNLSNRVPVFLGEFGFTGLQTDLEFGRQLMEYSQQLEIGWAAWSWFNDPLLVARYAATDFGDMVRRQLARS
jgi:hypothetical protein